MPSPRSFSGSFVFAITQAIVEAFQYTVTGTASGQRYFAAVSAIIYTGSGGPNIFPGTVAGVVDASTFAIYT
jgi:hypothetical protein